MFAWLIFSKILCFSPSQFLTPYLSYSQDYSSDSTTSPKFLSDSTKNKLVPRAAKILWSLEDIPRLFTLASITSLNLKYVINLYTKNNWYKLAPIVNRTFTCVYFLRRSWFSVAKSSVRAFYLKLIVWMDERYPSPIFSRSTIIKIHNEKKTSSKTLNDVSGMQLWPYKLITRPHFFL